MNNLKIKSIIEASMGPLDVEATREVFLDCDSTSVNDDYNSVGSSDSPISEKSSINGTSKSVGGNIAKTLSISSASASISIKTVTNLPETNTQNDNPSGTVNCRIAIKPSVTAASMGNRDAKLMNIDDNNHKLKLNSESSSHELCVEKQMKETKRLIEFISQICQSNKSNWSNMPNQDRKPRKKVDKFKPQIDSTGAKDHRKIERRKSVHLVKTGTGITNEIGSKCKSAATSKTVRKIPDARKSIEIPSTIEEVKKLYPMKNPIFYLDLSSDIDKKQTQSATRSVYNKCNPLGNFNRCIPYDAVPFNRKANICFCYCAYRTRGTDGVTYHTLCQCCESSIVY